MGVRLARVQRKPLIKYIRTYGTVTYDETRIYTVNTKFNGWIEKLYVDFEGTKVRMAAAFRYLQPGACFRSGRVPIGLAAAQQPVQQFLSEY